MNDLSLMHDHAHAYLIPYLKRTEEIFLSSLRRIDPNANCRITPAVDLGIPHDVIRIAGGFATGCLVEWDCSTPIIPIDTTVNIDTTSVFTLDADLSDRFTENFLSDIRSKIENDSSYEWNFHKGNHFISLTIRSSDGKPCLVFHSNEKEFKYQINGLMPVESNWFMNSVSKYSYEDRFIRILIGYKAELFSRMAKMLEEYNIIRHRLIAELIVDGVAKIDAEEHNHHYFMPNNQSVAIGCYLCDFGNTVPILSRPGRSIDLFQPHSGGRNELILLDNSTKIVVPHGWGKTSLVPFSGQIAGNEYHANGHCFPIEPKSTLGKHPMYVLRDFSDDMKSERSFYNNMLHSCAGSVKDHLIQVAWYNKDGVAHK